MADTHMNENADGAADTQGAGWFGFAYVIASVAGLGFFALSFLLLGIIPGRQLDRLVREQAPATMMNYTAAEERGRQIYGREGCSYCHTQQVRFLPADVKRWGAPTEAWETKYDAPHLWGTRRIGPDLAREAGVRSNDWQYAHLYNPRLVVPNSVMPGYPWLFQGDAGHPTEEARDVVAYLQALGRARELVGDTGAHAGAMQGMAGMEALQAGADLNPNKARVATDPPGLLVASIGDARALAHGRALFGANCSGCHGASGAGDGPAARFLTPRPANLLTARLAPERIAKALWNGVPGTAMPAWREWSVNDLSDLTAYVSAMGGRPAAHMDMVSSPQTASARPIAAGEALFLANCASCHGPDGAGDGPAAAALSPFPTNFHTKQPTLARARDVLAHGVPGTSMPAWESVLSVGQREQVIAYLRSLYGTPQQKPEN